MRDGGHSRRWWVATSVVAVLLGGGMYWLVSFLIGLTLSDADQWMSVVGGLVTAAAAGVSAVLWFARRASASGLGAEAGGSHFHVTAGRDAYTAQQMNFQGLRRPDDETSTQ